MKYLHMAVMGLVVGALAKLFYIGDNGNGIIMTMLVGLAGSFGAGMVGSMVDKTPGTQMKPAGYIMSIIGAMVLIYIAKRFGIQL